MKIEDQDEVVFYTISGPFIRKLNYVQEAQSVDQPTNTKQL